MASFKQATEGQPPVKTCQGSVLFSVRYCAVCRYSVQTTVCSNIVQCWLLGFTHTPQISVEGGGISPLLTAQYSVR